MVAINITLLLPENKHLLPQLLIIDHEFSKTAVVYVVGLYLFFFYFSAIAEGKYRQNVTSR